MYLSSFRVGDRPRGLVELAGSATVAVIGNAMDMAPEEVRRREVEYELGALGGLGLRAVQLDLRDYFDRPERLGDELRRFGAVWVRGGNVFVLRHAMARSGADQVLPRLVHEDALGYAGYSAGCCVLAHSLRGLELVDDPEDVRRHYDAEPTWAGLGLLDYAFVPHFRSDHPESAAIEAVAEHYRERGIPYRTLRDGEAIVIR